MAIVAEREARAERLEIRLTPSVKTLLTHAANVRHCSLTEFLLSSAVKAAEETVTSPRVFYASEDGWDELSRLLDTGNEYTPSPELVARLRRVRPMS